MTTNASWLDDLLETLEGPIVFCDLDHVIRYMNDEARKRYAGKPADVGRSILECHNERSNAFIRDVCSRLADGEDEVPTSLGKTECSYMCAVRDADGQLVGYYERHERRD